MKIFDGGGLTSIICKRPHNQILPSGTPGQYNLILGLFSSIDNYATTSPSKKMLKRKIFDYYLTSLENNPFPKGEPALAKKESIGGSKY